ncbi:MAG: V-type ATPase subunit [Clostridiales bacterium]|nr:V-type ATPase subunit [Clostridiales bacterium]
MLKSRMKYGAMAAKVMTLYGKLLKDEDWRRLYECRTVSDVYSFLRNHDGWSGTMSALPPAPQPKVLQTAIRKELYRDFEKLYNFSALEDKRYLRFALLQTEYECILSALKEKCSYEPLSKMGTVPDFIRKHSSVDIDALEQSGNFTSVLAAVKGSVYEKPLSGLKTEPETGMPNYREASVLLENVCFKSTFSFLSRKYTGMGRKKLEELIGTEADILNILNIIRLQRSFRSSLERADDLLIPVSYRLKPEFFHALQGAKSEDEVIELLRKSPFGEYFTGIDLSNNIENLYYKTMEKLCRKLIKSAEPDLGMVQAYLILKEFECKKLMRVIEAINAGIDPKSAV